MRNRYPGYCYYCGKWVEKGDGHFERSHGHWLLIHADCCLKQREEKARAKALAERCDEERREVARRLREIEQGVIGALIPTGELAENILRAIDYGHSGAMTPYGCLADLIEPSGDHDALLALADEMERMPQCELCPAEIVDCSAHPDGCPDALLDHYACRIREALGMEDHANHDDEPS